MKKKMAFTFFIAAAFSVFTALSGCAKDNAPENMFAGSLYASEDTAGATGGVIIDNDTETFGWSTDKMAALSGVVSGFGGEIDGSGGIREVRALLSYDTSIVKSITFDTSGVEFGTAGGYEVTYTILMDREALLEWMEKNDVAVTAYPGLNAAGSTRVRIEATGVIAVTSNAETVSGENLGDTDGDGYADGSTDSTEAAEISGRTGSSSGSTGSSDSSSSGSSSGSSSPDSSSSGSSSSGSSSSSGASGNSGSSSSGASGSSSSNSGSSTSGSSSSSSGSSSSGSSSSSSSGGSSGSSPAAAHTHSYTSTVTKAATCGSTGVRTYTCSCGASYTEAIAATGEHSWEETGYYEYFENKKSVGTIIVCRCGAEYSSTSEWKANSTCYTQHRGYSTKTKWETYTDSVWVPTGYKCSVCGATK